MTLDWLAVLVKCSREPRTIPIILAILRVCICFLPQTGYLHPDEFFQSTDIVGGRYFNSKIQPVWEFKTDKPIRCMLIPSLLNNLAFKIATLIQRQPSAYLLLVCPRLIYTLLSFIVDISLYRLCQYYSSRGLWYLPISIIFQTSFVCLGCLTRSLSNTSEVVIFALLLVVVCQTIRPRFRIMFVTPTRSTPVNERVKGSTQFKSSILVGILITLGTFNRPTFPCFALVPSIYWIVESLKRNSFDRSLTIQRVIVPIIISAGLTAIPISAFDTIYYLGDTQILKNLLNHIIGLRFGDFYQEIQSRWILTPYNFVRYNTNVDNLSKYGLHLPYTHILVNIPIAFSVLGLMFYGKLVNLLVGSGVYRLIFSTHRVYALMLLSTLTSTILLSFIPHQEFRFLLPLIVPLVFAFAFPVYTSNKWLPIWLLTNFVLVYFYTSIHQAGVMRASLDLDPILKSYKSRLHDDEEGSTTVDVVAFKCYLVPSYQWNIRTDDDRFSFDLQDTFDDFNTSVNLKLGRIVRSQLENPQEHHDVYILLPQLYEKDLAEQLEHNLSINPSRLKLIKHYSPHFSGEEFQRSFRHIREFGVKVWREAFGFSMLRLDLKD